jgi:hypothetical protein
MPLLGEAWQNYFRIADHTSRTQLMPEKRVAYSYGPVKAIERCGTRRRVLLRTMEHLLRGEAAASESVTLAGWWAWRVLFALRYTG